MLFIWVGDVFIRFISCSIFFHQNQIFFIKGSKIRQNGFNFMRWDENFTTSFLKCMFVHFSKICPKKAFCPGLPKWKYVRIEAIRL